VKKIIEEIGEKNFLLLLNHLLVMKRKPFFNSFDDAMECIMERGIYGILIREGVARDEDEAKKIFFDKKKNFLF
jgi:hypothetical protein